MKQWPKLTEKQQFALDCVRKGHVEVRRVHNKFVRSWAGGTVITQFWAIDSDVTEQIKALRKRKLVMLRFNPMRVEIALEKVDAHT